MVRQRNYIAISKLVSLAWLLVFAWAAQAAPEIGTVSDLSGPLLARKADGAIKALSLKSTVEQGDTLISAKDTYARIRFADNSEITLKPNTQFKIESFSFEAAKPESDNVIFSLIKGGLRSVTGLLGKRSNERFSLLTPTATIGIRGTIFIAEYVSPDDDADVVACGMTAPAVAFQYGWRDDTQNPFNPAWVLPPLQLALANLPVTDVPHGFLPEVTTKPMQLAQNTPGANSTGRSPGLYVQVLDGAINLTNGGGSQNFAAGQFGFTGGFKQPPVILPTNPGMQFTPPPSFSSTSSSQGGSGGAKPGTVDCQVR